jgi:hypothetical protein
MWSYVDSVNIVELGPCSHFDTQEDVLSSFPILFRSASRAPWTPYPPPSSHMVSLALENLNLCSDVKSDL